jgi:hypothetical protein
MVNGEVGTFFTYDDYLHYTNKKHVMLVELCKDLDEIRTHMIIFIPTYCDVYDNL